MYQGVEFYYKITNFCKPNYLILYQSEEFLLILVKGN